MGYTTFSDKPMLFFGDSKTFMGPWGPWGSWDPFLRVFFEHGSRLAHLFQDLPPARPASKQGGPSRSEGAGMRAEVKVFQSTADV